MSLKPFFFFVALIILTVIFLYFPRLDLSIMDYQLQAEMVISQCATETTKIECYEQAFAKITSKEGLIFSSRVLQVLQTLDADARQCHSIAHTISSTAARSNPSSWTELISQVGMADCAGGYLHGIIEGHIAYDPDFTVNADSITEICGNQSNNVAQLCAHGFGHVLLFQTRGDVNEASRVCSNVSFLATECYNGMFMEDAFKDMLFEHEIIKERRDPTVDVERFLEVKKLCLDFKSNSLASYACWSNLGHIVSQFYKYDEKKVYAACNEGPTEHEKRGCYLRAVSSLAISPDFFETNRTLSLCAPYQERGDSTAYLRCIQYISATLIYHTTEFSNQTIKFCLAVDNSFQEGCFKAFIAMLARNTTRADRVKICALLPIAFKDDCVAGRADGINLFQNF